MTNEQAIECFEIWKEGYTKSSVYWHSVVHNEELGDDVDNKIKYLELAIKALKIDDRRKYIISVYESYKQTAPVREVIEALKECEGNDE